MAKVLGKFVDSESGEGIINSRVELRDESGNVIAVTATDTAGDFVFSGISPGVYWAIGKSPIHMPTKFRFEVVDPGVRIELRTVKIIL